MTSDEKSKITDLKKCNFTEMSEYFKAQSEARKAMTKEEKQVSPNALRLCRPLTDEAVSVQELQPMLGTFLATYVTAVLEAVPIHGHLLVTDKTPETLAALEYPTWPAAHKGCGQRVYVGCIGTRPKADV